MKKTRILTLVLVVMLAMVTLLSGCGKKGDDLVGTWVLTSASAEGVTVDLAEFGLEMTLTLEKDGACKMMVTGEEDGIGTWTKSDKGVSITADEETLEFELKDGKLIANEDGLEMVFTRK